MIPTFTLAQLTIKEAIRRRFIWAAFLIVAGTCVLLVGSAVGIVFLNLRHLSGLRRTRKSVTEGIGMLRRDGKHPAVGGDGAPEISPDGHHPQIAGGKSR